MATRLTPVALAVLGLLFGSASAAVADPAGPLPPAYYGPLPVSLSKVASQHAGLSDKNALPAGANYFDPSLVARHPHPVVLVHGMYDNGVSAWYSLAPLLRNAGFNVWVFNFGRYSQSDIAGGLTDIRSSGRELQADVAQVLAATGADKVDLVGHSEGSAIIAWYVNELGGDSKVGKVVDLGGSTVGVSDTEARAARAAFSALVGHDVPAAEDGSADSPFFRTLLAHGATRPDVQYTFIGTRYDEMIVPRSSNYLPAARNVTDIELQDRYATDYGDHFALPYDPYALAETVHALDSTIKWNIPVGIVLPYEGGYTPLR